jgi:spore coat protein U-like protein
MTFRTTCKGLLAGAVSAVLMLSVAPHALSAEDGTVGTTSEGRLDIDLLIPQLIRITGLQDIDLGTYDGDGADRSANANACVRGNDQFNYRVTATSENGAFVLRDDGETDILYTVSWAGDPLDYDTVSEEDYEVDSQSLGSCSGGENRVAINVPAAGMDQAVPGAYTDTLILTVEPL